MHTNTHCKQTVRAYLKEAGAVMVQALFRDDGAASRVLWQPPLHIQEHAYAPENNVNGA